MSTAKPSPTHGLSADRAMTRARGELVLDHPFFATLALRLEMRADDSCRTAWCDGRVLAYNPGYIESLPLAKVKGLQCHEVLHLACRHHTRRKGRNVRLWNMACDYAINPVLLEAGIELPAGFLDDPAHHGKGAEEIYAFLVARDEESRGGADQGPEQEAEGQDEMDGVQGESEERLGASERVEPSGETAEEAEQGDEGAGMGADGDAEDDSTPGETDPGMSGEVRDAAPESGGNDSSLQQEEEASDIALAQALHKAREAGDLPGSLERLVARVLSPALHWREILRRFLSRAAHNDFSWTRPNRRYLHMGLHLPGLHSEELSEIAVAVDVSGSITQAELDGFAGELSAVLEEFDTAISVFTCDAALTTRERLARWDLPLRFAARGGGGTDFRPPFEALESGGAAPACLIYFTDLESNRFPEEPEYPVLWVTTNPDPTLPPFGEVVSMERLP